MKLSFNNLFNTLASLMAIFGWLMGTVMAFDKGIGYGICSIIFGPFYSWYLVVKHIMAITGFYPGV